MLLLAYAKSPFLDFESYLRIVVRLDEEDNQLILKKYNSHFITYGLPPGIYSIQDILDTIYTFSGHMETIQIEYDDISMKTKIILKYIEYLFENKIFNSMAYFQFYLCNI